MKRNPVPLVGKRDKETGLDYRGARFYDSDVARFLSLDPHAAKYPTLSDFVYVAGNPIKFIDPDGKEYVDADGNTISVEQDENGNIILGENATEDLRRIVTLLNDVGSKTATKQFMKIHHHITKIHVVIDKTSTKVDGRRVPFAIHTPHGEDGKKLRWNYMAGKFIGDVAFTKDKNGNLAYKEATITFYETAFTEENINW